MGGHGVSLVLLGASARPVVRDHVTPVGQQWEIMVSLSYYIREVSVRSVAGGRGVFLILGRLSVGQRGRSWSLSHIRRRCGRSAERSPGISFIWSWEE